MTSEAGSVDEYVADLPPGRREPFERLCAVIKERLPPGFEETMSWGIPCWAVPLATFPEGYLGNPRQPLPLLSIAWQKRHLALYHMGLYANPVLLERFLAAYEAAVGKKPDMGKSCLRFADPSRIPYELIGELASWITVDECISYYVNARTARPPRTTAG